MGEISFRDITVQNWSDLEIAVLNSEKVFEVPVQVTRKTFLYMISQPNPVAKAMFLDLQYIGNAIGYSPTKANIKQEELLGIKEDKKSIYLFNFVIDEEFKGKGYGYQLLAEFIRCAKAQGYKKLQGHFKDAESAHLIRKFGAKDVRAYKNWQGSGQTHILCEFSLDNIADFPYYKQKTEYTCGPASMKMALEHFGIKRSEEELASTLRTERKVGTSEHDMIMCADFFKMNYAVKRNASFEDLERLQKEGYVTILRYYLPWEKIDHYAVFKKVDRGRIYLWDPCYGPDRSYSLNYFSKIWKFDPKIGKDKNHWLLALKS